MLLRRITEHVKAQNWTAVTLDFVIVVVGVFIGIQVANWNASRQEHARAQSYSVRLLNELHAEYDTTISLANYYMSSKQAGQIAYAGLTDNKSIDDETILINAFRASQYNWYERRRATFDEIVASGALDLISDEQLRKTAIGAYNTPVFSILQLEGQNAEYRELFRKAINPEMHELLNDRCGDKEYDGSDFAVGLLTIEYECEVGAPREAISEAVQALNADPEIRRALGLRIAEMSSAVANLEFTLDFQGMNDLFAGERK